MRTQIFRPSRPPLGAHPASCKMGTASFPGVKCGRGVLLTTHTPYSAAVMEQYSYTSTHPVGHTGPVTGSLYLYLYDDNSTAIPLPTIWATPGLLQDHFTFTFMMITVQLYLYPPSGPHRARNGITLPLLFFTTKKLAPTCQRQRSVEGSGAEGRN